MNILQNLTATVTAAYQYKEATTGMSCTVTAAKVTQQSDWGMPTLVNMFDLTVTLQGFPEAEGKTALTGQFVMKNSFVQNFWSNFGIKTSSFSGATGNFTGDLWGKSFTLGGFIGNTVPLTVGSNPLVSMTVNGVVCQ